MPDDQTYSKTIWVDDDVPDIDATNLNKLEQGIYDAHDRLNKTINRGTDAGKPSAASVGAQALYWATDTGILYESNGTVWAAVRPAALANTIRYSAGIGATPDNFFRVFPGGALISDPAGWNNSTGSVTFALPVAGKWLMSWGLDAPNGNVGVCGIFLCKGSDNTPILGARAAITGGGDADASLPRSGVHGGPVVLDTVTQGTLLYKFGGYFSGAGGGTSAFDVWATGQYLGPH